MKNAGMLGVLESTRLTMTEDELSAAIGLLNEELTERRERSFKKMKYSMKPGDIVSFIDNTGKRVEGEVKKVKQKKAIVNVGSTNWDVPIGMLSPSR
jgi:hypothetical protein